MADKLSIAEAKIELNRCKVNGYMPTDWERRCRAVDTVLAALDRQEPRKPLPDTFYYGFGKCRTCGAIFTDNSTNHCGNCGQALDWKNHDIGSE